MILCVCNNKGGVAKTASSVEIGAEAARQGLRVLAVDCDPQGSMGAALRVAPAPREAGLGEVLWGDATGRRPGASEVIVPTYLEGLSLLPCTMYLANAPEDAPATALLEALRPIEPEYDLILLDSQPSLGPLLTFALLAAQEYLLPVSADWQSGRALGGFVQAMEAQSRRRPEDFPHRLGILITRYDTRTSESRDIAGELRAAFGPEVFGTVIREDVAVKRSAKYGTSVADVAPKARAAKDYATATTELLSRLRLRGYAV